MKHFLLFLFSFILLIACKKEDDKPSPGGAAGAKYAVTYSGNGNTGGVAPTDGNTYENGSSAVVLGNVGNLVKTNYSFQGWNSKADGTGTNYAAGSKLTFNQSNVTLYAKWLLNSASTKFQVTYLGNGNSSGTVPVDNNSYAPGTSFTVKSNTGGLSQNGNAFLSWNTSPNGNGQTYSPGTQASIQSNLSLYAIYSASTPSGRYFGFNTSGQVKRKSTLTSSWIDEDLSSTFGSSSLVTVVWNGSQYIGFNSSGQVKRKSTLTSSWISEDLSNTFGTSSLVAVVWNGSQYIGFNSSGQVKRKSTLTSVWVNEDLSSSFGTSSIVSVVWNGSQYIGFNSSGQVKRKSTLTSSWISEDLSNTFGTSSLVAVVWNGSQYIGFNSSGQVKRKSSLTASWISEDLNNSFGSSSLKCATYH
ncbi:InlB B-repeat-containing protein [Adhaeribacter soli]|uniref:InlB B-repeat-containing protein n=1 Tax=Adhaeribacter soli TaxID=2607655 RepID=A0A5N1IM25_9BACT|nr:InlB B-repeat-containing protein [Adhaeribacter soli]KAA9325704.1 InlB B-repeat-containing protein [Adhaeribacter soli]